VPRMQQQLEGEVPFAVIDLEDWSKAICGGRGVCDRNGNARPIQFRVSIHSYRLHRVSFVTLTYLSPSSYEIGVMQ